MQLFRSDLPFYKGNTHVHTTLSDGQHTPEQVMAEYKANGYDFLVITDHRKVFEPTEYNGMIVLGGTELDYTFTNEVLHITAALPNGKLDAPCVDPQTDIDAINAAGGVAILAHPAWSLNTTELMSSLNGFCAAEIYNTVSGTPWNGPRADSSISLDILFSTGKLLNLVAVDDAHWCQGEQCVSYTMVQAEALTHDAIIDALRQGHFYASQGPRIFSADWTDGVLTLDTSPVDSISFLSNRKWTGDRTHTGSGMTHHVYHTEPLEDFIRVEMSDRWGRRAWLNPIATGNKHD